MTFPRGPFYFGGVGRRITPTSDRLAPSCDQPTPSFDHPSGAIWMHEYSVNPRNHTLKFAASGEPPQEIASVSAQLPPSQSVNLKPLSVLIEVISGPPAWSIAPESLAAALMT